MRIYMTDGTRTVQLTTSTRERTGLKDAEKTVRRLFATLPAPAPDKPKPPVGFAGTVKSDTELAASDETEEDRA
ncbi:hypothetical protein [Streptomyces sp. NPDC046371]|uniref:hypothetical protein n=1 Tax=Streptomyces sp. NPDC046371 TaxID=3154916 RepID=UPI0033EEEEC8